MLILDNNHDILLSWLPYMHQIFASKNSNPPLFCLSDHVGDNVSKHVCKDFGNKGHNSIIRTMAFTFQLMRVKASEICLRSLTAISTIIETLRQAWCFSTHFSILKALSFK